MYVKKKGGGKEGIKRYKKREREKGGKGEKEGKE
jgi:hypothetical protein